ncbi:MAG: alpha/beta hydrolase [Candidatus Melainabacteria bacterium]|nr:alpha/beta hydrolase [Candidatus Melainabacteria bacterium]
MPERDPRLDPQPFLIKLLRQYAAGSDSLQVVNSDNPLCTLFCLHKKSTKHDLDKESIKFEIHENARLSKLLSLKGPKLKVQDVIFESQPGLWVNGYFLWPVLRDNSKNLPCLICIPGHGCVEDIVGVGSQQSEISESHGYQNEFALRLAQRGYPVFAIEQLGFGKRQFKENFFDKPMQTSCNKPGKLLLAVNSSLLAFRVHDVKRAVDFVRTRPEISAAKIGLVGISAGGTTALVSAALDPRVKLTAVSGALCSMVDCFADQEHCLCNYVPGLLQIADIPSIAGRIAPRFLVIEHGKNDSTNLFAQFKTAKSIVLQAYSKVGAARNLVFDEFNGGHYFNGSEIYKRLAATFPQGVEIDSTP